MSHLTADMITGTKLQQLELQGNDGVPFVAAFWIKIFTPASVKQTVAAGEIEALLQS